MTASMIEVKSGFKVNVRSYLRRLELSEGDSDRLGRVKAHLQWHQRRQDRLRQHAERVHGEELALTPKLTAQQRQRRRSMGRPRAIWCVELQRRFDTLCAAAAFVDRKPSNIHQALVRRCRCGPYHWMPFDPARHRVATQAADAA